MTRTLSATLAAVVLLVACGGERREGAAPGAADSGVSGTAAVAPTDTARADTAADTTTHRTAAAPTDTGANRPAASKADGKKLTKRDTARVRQAEQDPGKAAAPSAAPAPSAAATAAADQPLRDAYHQAPKDTVDQATYDGWKQFNLNCARCHGEDALGTTIAPHLILSLKPDGPINTKELFMQTVCAGRPEKGMPAWCALGLDMQKISDIYLYVKGRSDAKISPGRPAVKGG
jgi:mono/diheme cytochrome c family protein